MDKGYGQAGEDGPPEGLEEGHNRGKGIDSRQRYIYIHGTNRIDELGRAASGGCVRLAPENCEDALLASGSIPLVCEPVRDPAGAARGDYWDGGLIDYHLALPYHTLGGIVLYPHFVPYVTPGWLDKFLPWRKRPRTHPWLDNVLLIAPSREFLARLPGGRLPERQDFYRYGLDHAARIRAWRRAIGECERFADEVMAWLERPDPTRLMPL